MKTELMTALTLVAMMTMAQLALAVDGGTKANLSQQANNPIANMISVPFQLNANYGVGPRDQNQNVLTIQPVIPFELNQDWLLVSRWMLPFVDQPDFAKGSGRVDGTGDLNAAFFFSPSSRMTGLPEELVFGFGPGIQAPTASNSQLGSGPTALAVYTKDKWVVGALNPDPLAAPDRSAIPDAWQPGRGLQEKCRWSIRHLLLA